MSVMVGVSAGLILLSLINRPHAEALSNSLTQDAQAFSGGHQPLMPASSLLSFPSLDRRMNILLMGVDSNGRNTERFVNTRSDTLILVSCDPVSRKVGLVSIPRDSRVSIEGHGINKINSAHALGGPELAVSTVSSCFQVPVDHYVVVDTEGLKKLFETLGPVEVLVEKSMHYRDRTARLNVDLEPGLQALDAAQAEEYVRFRHDPRGDLGRIERQQWFLRQVAQKLKDPQTLFKLPQLFSLARDFVVTDLSIEDMARLASFLKDIEPTQIETATLPGTAATIAGGSYWLPDPSACRLVFDRLAGTNLAFDSVLLGIEDGQPGPRLVSYSESTGPMSVAIKYSRGGEQVAKTLESLVTNAGYQVKYRWQVPASECQHDQIIQMSAQADAVSTENLRKAVPDVASWPTVLSLEARPAADFVLVLSPSSSPVAATNPSPLSGRHLDPVLAY